MKDLPLSHKLPFNADYITEPLRKLINLLLGAPQSSDSIKIAADAVLITVAAGWAWLISYGQVAQPGSPLPFMAVAVCSRVALNYLLKLHRRSWLHVSRYEVFDLAISAILALPVIALIFFALPPPFTFGGLTRPYLLLITEPALYMLLVCGARIAARGIANGGRPQARSKTQLPKILIVGAQAAGRALAFHIEEMTHDYQIAGFVDEAPDLQRRWVRGLPVLGTPADVPRLTRELGVQEIVIALSPLPPDALRQLLVTFEPSGLPVRIMPSLKDLFIGSKEGAMTLREVQVEDLLPRPEVQLDYAGITSYLGGKTVLVTGGGGSIGSELCRQVLAAGAARLVILGRGENSIFEITEELTERDAPCELIPVICSVRDRTSLQQIFQRYRPQVVFHTAAHKHVPLMEQYPSEAVRNNVLGTLNVVETAVENQVEHFVMVSTDKAVDPRSVMGATKRLGEMIVSGYAAASGLDMVSVRFGNVLGSRGSVVPTMKRQIRQGRSITITDPNMVRYFMTIPEASRLILQAGAVGGCGEVFILDMGRPVRILDLAHDLIRLSGLVPEQDIKIKITGCRPGEKIREEILTEQEANEAEKRGPFYVSSPKPVNLPVLLGQIERLRTFSEAGDDARVLALMGEIIPNSRFDPAIGGLPASQSYSKLKESCQKNAEAETDPMKELGIEVEGRAERQPQRAVKSVASRLINT